ncbi:MAG TPA: hypothetical protein VFY89_00150 [Ktedonobacterales bacterium]
MAMEGTMADWRLFGDHEHLRGAKLWWREYAPRNEIWAQDQCALCWTTFAKSGEEAWHEGYATQPPHGVAESAPEPAPADEEEDEYVTAVLAAVKAAPKTEEPPAPPEPDPAIEASLLEAIQLPSTAVEAPQGEPVQWICPQCFQDFQEYFGWQVKNAG